MRMKIIRDDDKPKPHPRLRDCEPGDVIEVPSGQVAIVEAVDHQWTNYRRVFYLSTARPGVLGADTPVNLLDATLTVEKF